LRDTEFVKMVTSNLMLWATNASYICGNKSDMNHIHARLKLNIGQIMWCGNST